MINRMRVEELVLARIWTAPKRGVKKSEIKRALAPFVEHAFSPAEWSSELDRLLAKLIADGELSEQPLQLTDRGQARLLKSLRLSPRAPRMTWKTFKSSLGLARALAIDDAKSIAGPRLGAFLLARRHNIDGVTSVNTAIDTLLWRQLGLQRSDTLTLSKLRAEALARALGSDGKRDLKRLRRQAIAEAAGSTSADAESVRRAVMRRWLSASDAPAHEQPAPPRNDLARFAKRVLEVAGAKETRRFGEEAFISSIWEQMSRSPAWKEMSLADFKTQLVEANRAGLLRLNRADLVAAMDEDDVARSETRYLNATFHFVELERTHP